MFFKNRGHYCNYCRKIATSKCKVGFNHVVFNKLIWHVWDTNQTQAFILDIKSVEVTNKMSILNKQIKSLYPKYNLK